MLDAFSENPELFAALDEDELTDPDLMVDVIGVAKDCLDPDELAATFTEGMLEGSDVELTPEQAGCLGDELLADDDLLAVLLVLGIDPDATPTADQIGPLFELFATCDLAPVIAESIQADDPTMTDEQALCARRGHARAPARADRGAARRHGRPQSARCSMPSLELFATCDIDLGPSHARRDLRSHLTEPVPAPAGPPPTMRRHGARLLGHQAHRPRPTRQPAGRPAGLGRGPARRRQHLLRRRPARPDRAPGPGRAARPAPSSWPRSSWRWGSTPRCAPSSSRATCTSTPSWPGSSSARRRSASSGA